MEDEIIPGAMSLEEMEKMIEFLMEKRTSQTEVLKKLLEAFEKNESKEFPADE